MPLNPVLDALLVVATWAAGLALVVLALWKWLGATARREMNEAIAKARRLFAFLEAKGFSRSVEHRGDSFDFIWVEYQKGVVIARVVREKTYWGVALRRSDLPEVSFDAIEAFPLIGLGNDPCLPYGHTSAESLAASVEPVLDLLLALVDKDGMNKIEERRPAAVRTNSLPRQVSVEDREQQPGV